MPESESLTSKLVWWADEHGDQYDQAIARWERTVTSMVSSTDWTLQGILDDAVLGHGGDHRIDRARAHAVWAGRRMILDTCPGDAVAPHVWELRDLTWGQVLGEDLDAAVKIQRSLHGDQSRTVELARDLASGIHASSGKQRAGAVHLIRRAGAGRWASPWMRASVATWWHIWAKAVCEETVTQLGPLPANRPDAAALERRATYAAVVTACLDAGRGPTDIARWLGVTRQTVYNLRQQETPGQ